MRLVARLASHCYIVEPGPLNAFLMSDSQPCGLGLAYGWRHGVGLMLSGRAIRAEPGEVCALLFTLTTSHWCN